MPGTVDSHVHIFPNMGGKSGFESVERHMQFATQIMFHRSEGRRLHDNAPVVGREWHKGEDLYQVNLRGGDFGRFLWTADGVDYARYYLPPTARDLDSPPEQIIAQMDYIGVERGVVQAGHVYGRLNDYLARVAEELSRPALGSGHGRRVARRRPQPDRRDRTSGPGPGPPRPVLRLRADRQIRPHNPARRPNLRPVLGDGPPPGHPRLLEHHFPGSGCRSVARTATVLRPVGSPVFRTSSASTRTACPSTGSSTIPAASPFPTRRGRRWKPTTCTRKYWSPY